MAHLVCVLYLHVGYMRLSDVSCFRGRLCEENLTLEISSDGWTPVVGE